MKKMIIAAMALACTAAFANGQAAGTQQQQKQNTEVVSTSAATSQARGGEQQQQQGIKDSGNSSAQAGVQSAGNSAVTVGCLVNCASTDQGSKDLADAGVAAALINAEAAKAIAKTNADAAYAVAGRSIKNTPGVVGAALVSSNDTCMGSVSAGGSGPGFGLSIGTTYKDDNCVMLKNSRELWNMGMKAASMALMCTDKANREALEITGFECPQTTKAKADAQKVAEATQPQYTDPIVRARMGLPALTASAK